MTNHDDNHDQAEQNDGHPLTEAELTAVRFPALITLAALRGDAAAMGDHVEHAAEHMTVGQMIESQAIEFAAVMLTIHGSVEAADKALTASVLRMNAGTL